MSEGRGVDLDNAVFDECFGTDEFVVGGVVDDIEDFGFFGDALASPGEVALVQAHGAEFVVASHNTDTVHSFIIKFGIGSRPSRLELSLLLVDRHATSRKSPLVS